jgi:hypothetical protein
MKVLCKCNKEIESKFSDKEKMHYFYCPDCKLGGKAKTEKEAAEKFQQAVNNAALPIENLPVPKSQTDFLQWVTKNETALIAGSAQFIDKPATTRMIQKNARYIAQADLKNAWNSPEGKQSIVDAMSEALYFGATMPEMGCVVPFGKTDTIVEFIPAVSAFQFALTSGKSAPFSEIHINPIYQNDQYEISRKDGAFHFEIKKMGIPRGDIIGIVVQAFDIESEKMIGEAYDEERLMKKAEQHSISYRYYLQDMALLKQAQAEGKDYIEKKQGWKIYEKDITNPYANADKPEMLKKLAGKSFLYPFMKVRNAKAIVDEWRKDDKTDLSTPEKILDNSLAAVKQDIQDAEFSIDDEPENIQPEKPDPKVSPKETTKKNTSPEQGDIFGEDGI